MVKSLLLKGLREGLGRIIVLISFITRPSKIKRSTEQQAAIALKAEGLSIYQFYACPFCVKTRRAVHKLNLPIAYRNAQAGEYREELAKEGGQIKVPCLRIEEGDSVQWMYESGDIIRYLNQRFAA
ncbi:glutathione S-transferase N-terminal domain-containing protein [Teredinibacter purpureus]|jgi:Glutaredoxin and related proteins|uniref:glutathione S-transferase N-terminal domain-containing protein n=1 Tax=Teredinibacter purpureus TaxID=2731756 RepID=UPI0005F7E219|nr:glutathione S-transferase N-terminal domain-containing protein [Teredinibacter purpureus]